ncbi:class D sortase [Siminovitchia acidinfaciens]|uniref:Class D sortase n=1 Tax=Siminovitchia acidinfaciens TaxID=2321395 RepID=A0A429XVC9_9BACI|nr:class D sortase [Siminovitchia acidinfaciens]RST72223.1 class D sortase [Siminovitchia acidinfaciens]
MRFSAIILIIIGLCFIGYSGFHIWNSNQMQNDSLQRAKEIISNDAGPKSYSFDPKVGEEIGILELPTLDESLPIIEGVDEDELAQGVGHYNGTSLPTEQGQIVLSGHRDTVFRRLGELNIGDLLVVKMPYGQFQYIIEKTEIVRADDLTVIRPEIDEELLTVTTCYPFRYVGNAPDRYIIYAKRKS